MRFPLMFFSVWEPGCALNDHIHKVVLLPCSMVTAQILAVLPMQRVEYLLLPPEESSGAWRQLDVNLIPVLPLNFRPCIRSP